MSSRHDGRRADEMRPLSFERHYTCYAEGSVLVSVGRTKVLCNATVTPGVPRFMKDSGEGWVTAEYSLLPRSTATRTDREAAKGKQSGRTMEIQRLIGRSLRGIVDRKKLGDFTVTVDCDVIQADGGTRTASITGAFVALVEACASFYEKGKIFPVKDFLSAIASRLRRSVSESVTACLCLTLTMLKTAPAAPT